MKNKRMKNHMKSIRLLLIIYLLLASYTQINAGINAGVARKVITPDTPVWLSGYASRTKPATEILHDLWAKALVIGENDKIEVIIVTIDIIGLSHEISENIAQRVVTKYGINRSQLLLNSSHTHSGPVIWPSLGIMYDLGKDDLKALVSYNSKLTGYIVDVIDMAILNMKPVNLSVAHGSADIAVNRRQQTEKGVVIGVNGEGHIDNDVPVLRVETVDGKIEAILFGYACHNTTLDTYQVNGDYAGFAQIDIEKANPGVTAMYLAGCGADQNPNPRRSVEIAMQHGKKLADAVQKTLSGTFMPVRPPVRTDITTIDLEFSPLNPDKLKEELVGDNRFSAGRARFVLMAMDKGYDVSTLSYPVQAIRFSNDFTILAMAGEVVVDYSLKAKARYPKENMFVAGYSNEVQCYIPTAKILKEGGYEPETSMIYYGLPGPFAENVELKIFSGIDKVMKKTGAKPVPRKYSVAE
jgi:neutral ceramidase